MHFFISAGEPSGDLHAANLIRALKRIDPEARISGYGGPRMIEAGADLNFVLVNLAVMWFLSVFANIATFLKLIIQADRFFRDERPDAVILIDYPGLHWWLARRAKKHGVPVFYFVPPQIWAWAPWRVKKIRRDFDLVLCSLPFEPAWYRARGVNHATFVGHPYFDELADRVLDHDFLAQEQAQPGRLVAILPGSRVKEIEHNLPTMLRAAALLSRRRDDVRFAIACLNEKHKAIAERILADLQAQGIVESAIPLVIHAGRTAEIIRLARAAWTVSGSVSLELLAERLPSVVLYTVSRVGLWIARPFIRTRFITLVNLLADRELFPEFLTCLDVSPQLAAWAEKWIDDGAERESIQRALNALADEVGKPGATERSAGMIVSWIRAHHPSGATQSVPAPHHASRASSSVSGRL